MRVADPERNADATLGFAARAADGGAQVVVFPELGLTGYTCGDLFFSLTTLVGGAERALERVLRETARRPTVLVLGLPVLQGGRLFNAAAVVQSGRVLGVVPKTFLPGYKEYYEERWFSSAREAREGEVRLAGQAAPFGTDLLFQLPEDPGVTLAVEICEDLWAPIPPSSRHAVAGATVLLNPSASNDLVAKAEYRRELVRQQSGRTLSAYVYANAGVHESTTDLVFGGHLLVAENGVLLAEGERFRRDGELVVTDVDVERLRVERARQTSFADAVHGAGPAYRTVALAPVPAPQPHRLVRTVDPHPFVPADPATLDERCREVFSIQTAGLARRLEHVGVKRVVLGLSGGLDSTLALLVCVRTFDLLGLPARGHPRRDHARLRDDRAHPGERAPARRRRGGRAARDRHPARLRAAHPGHRPRPRRTGRATPTRTSRRASAPRSSWTSRTRRAGSWWERGTSRRSRSAGRPSRATTSRCTASTPACPRRSSAVSSSGSPATTRATPRRACCVSVLETPVSPELVPPGRDGAISQKTEDLVGPYELHDFFLFCLLRWGAGPRKILFLAEHAFAGRYDAAALRRWLLVFLRRFFAQQWKRSVMPDGPKVGSVSLSPRGDWRMPSDADAGAWLRELEG